MTDTHSNKAISGDLATAAPADVILFDGVCNLCNGWVQWVLRRDHKGRYRFASLQSEVGRSLIQQYGGDPRALDSVALIRQGRLYQQSDAALQIVAGLGGGFRLAQVLHWLPKGLRDTVYRWVARNRYRWFGRKESCMIPKPEWRDRFLDN